MAPAIVTSPPRVNAHTASPNSKLLQKTPLMTTTTTTTTTMHDSMNALQSGKTSRATITTTTTEAPPTVPARPAAPTPLAFFKKRSLLSDDPRRDSGMASSINSSIANGHDASTPIQTSTALRDSSDIFATTGRPTTTASAVTPSIVIHDPNFSASVPNSPSKSSLSPPRPEKSVSVETAANGSTSRHPSSAATEDTWSEGILNTDIPTGEIDDPFSSERLQFSKRGSVLKKGKTSDKEFPAAAGRPYESPPIRTAKKNNSISLSVTGSLDEKDSDSMRMSTEERRLSKRVRSLYEANGILEEAAAAASAPPAADDADILASKLTDRLHDIGEEDELTTPNGTKTSDFSPRSGENNNHHRRVPSAMSSRASMRRGDFGEAAGGLEDFTDVDIKDVDRYGFIKPRAAAAAATAAASSKRSSVLSLSLPGTADGNRAPSSSTALDIVSEDPASQSTAAARPHSPSPSKAQRLSLLGQSSRRLTPSILSFRSKKSGTSTIKTFRSSSSSRKPYNKGARWLDEAGDMLTMPVGFGELASDDDEETSHTRKTKKSKEVKRSAKWAKMAVEVRPSQSSPREQKGSSSSGNKSSPSRREKQQQQQQHHHVVGGGKTYTFDTSSSKLVSRVWKGIPDRWRAVAWHCFLTKSAARRSPTGRPIPSDEALVRRFYHLQTLDCPDDAQIDMDVPRTIGSHIMFRRRYRGGQRLLFRVLRALALQYPRIGYVQGMAPIAATLLCYYEEEKAFVVGCRLWELRGVGWLYGGPGATSTGGPSVSPSGLDGSCSGGGAGFEGLMIALAQFERGWMSGTAVGAALNELCVAPTSFGTKWYLTLFSYSMPFRAMLRVWDVFILLGDPPSRSISPAAPRNTKLDALAPSASSVSLQHDDTKPVVDLSVLHAIGAALVHGLADVLIGADFENAMKALTSSLPVGREDVLMRVAKREWEERHLKKGGAIKS